MVTPNSLVELRRDGRAITESITPDQMLDEGWEPDKVVAVRWDYYGLTIDMRTPYGFLVQLVPNREFVAVLEETDATGDHSLLSVYGSNGGLQRSFRNLVEIGGLIETGEFLWFEEPLSPLPTAFAPVFNVARTGGTFQVDMDAATGNILAINEIR